MSVSTWGSFSSHVSNSKLKTFSLSFTGLTIPMNDAIAPTPSLLNSESKPIVSIGPSVTETALAHATVAVQRDSAYLYRRVAIDVSERVDILGAGLSGLSSAIILAKSGKEVHVHEVRQDSGARFDGDFQGIENWTSEIDFFDEMREWGLIRNSFKSNPFGVVDLVHPDDVITNPVTDGVAFRVVERGTDSHCIDQGFKKMALDAGVKIHYGVKVDPSQCDIIAAGPKESSAVAFGEIFETSHPNHVTFQLNDKLAPGAYSYMIIIDGVGLICTCLWRKQRRADVSWTKQ